MAKSASRELAALDNVRADALANIADLYEDAFPEGCVKLRGYRDLYRIRFYPNQYRIVYRTATKQRRVTITRIRPRTNAYEGL